MRTLTFNLISDSRFKNYPRRDLQEKIESINKKFVNMEGVYIKVYEPRYLKFSKENNYQYRAYCEVVKEKHSKYNWNEIMKNINEIYAPVYKYEDLYCDMEKYKNIKEKRLNPELLCSSLVGVTPNGSLEFDTGIIINGEKYSISVIKNIVDNHEEWKVDTHNNCELNIKQKEEIIEKIKNDPPLDIKYKSYVTGKVEVIDDLSKIVFDEEIEISEDNTIDLYFENAYFLFLTPAEDYEYNYYDGYLTIDLKENKVNIDIVVISDDNTRIYYTYEPTEEEKLVLIDKAEKYCQECYDKSLTELMKETIEEECNEQ